MSSKSINISTRKQTRKERKALENSIRTVTHQINVAELQWTTPLYYVLAAFYCTNKDLKKAVNL